MAGGPVGTARRWPVPAIAAAILGGLGAFLLSGGELNYDSEYVLAWGQELLAGEAPSYELPAAPTPHPLMTLVALVTAPLGDDGARTVTFALTYLAAGVLVVTAALLAAEIAGRAAGAIAGAVLVVSPLLAMAASAGFQDVVAAALVLVAVLVEVRRPRVGTPVLALLALAGLIRPEAWLFAGVYWVALAVLPERRFSPPWRLLPLAVAGPVLWALSDLAATGDPLFSLTHTQEGAEAAGRVTGAGAVPDALASNLRAIIELGAIVAAALGVALALRFRSRRAVVPLATAILGGLAFAALGVARVSLLERYLLVPAALGAVFAGVGAGWWLSRARPRSPLVPAGAVALLAIVAFVPAQVRRTADVRDVRHVSGDVVRDLTAVAATSGCETVAVQSFRPRPYVANALDLSPADVPVADRPAAGGVVLPGNATAMRAFLLTAADARPPRPAEGVAAVHRGRFWTLFGEACGAERAG